MLKQKKGYFEAFVSLKPSQVKPAVIVSPIVYPNQLGIKGERSILGYVTANGPAFTFIKTPMTQSAVADLVALLPLAKCRQVIFLGAIGGLADGLKIADVVKTDRRQHVHSVSSIHEETAANLKAWRRKGFLGIDFESEAFFKAAKQARLPAVAYYVVTDLPLTRPFYRKKTKLEELRIKDSVKGILAALTPAA